jgi:vancomycin resistance protein YoaR
MADERQATQAQQLLDNEMLNGALDSIEAEIVKKIKGANIDGTESAEAFVLELARKLQTAAAFKKSLQSHVTNYKMTKIAQT